VLLRRTFVALVLQDLQRIDAECSTGASPVRNACAAKMTIYRRKLPHIEKDGGSYLITFHTRDDLTLKRKQKIKDPGSVERKDGACDTKRVMRLSHL
jgi:hypothetical protein